MCAFRCFKRRACDVNDKHFSARVKCFLSCNSKERATGDNDGLSTTFNICKQIGDLNLSPSREKTCLGVESECPHIVIYQTDSRGLCLTSVDWLTMYVCLRLNACCVPLYQDVCLHVTKRGDFCMRPTGIPSTGHGFVHSRWSFWKRGKKRQSLQTRIYALFIGGSKTDLIVKSSARLFRERNVLW